jgi:citrate lyase beta subunit
VYKSLLFVPGYRPDRFEKAVAAGPDAVCIDLEDAVAPHAKHEACSVVAEYLQRGARHGLGVRINGPTTDLWHEDRDALRCAPSAFVMIPKPESAEQVTRVSSRLGPGHPPLWAVIESVRGLQAVRDIAAVTGLAGLLFGAYDLSADLGCEPQWDCLLYARGTVVAAGAETGLELLEAPWLGVADEVGLSEAAFRAKTMGFTGCSCIHPKQVRRVNEVFTPATAEVEPARRVLEAFERSEGGVALLDSKLIEAPIVRSARRVLDKAGG